MGDDGLVQIFTALGTAFGGAGLLAGVLGWLLPRITPSLTKMLEARTKALQAATDTAELSAVKDYETFTVLRQTYTDARKDLERTIQLASAERTKLTKLVEAREQELAERKAELAVLHAELIEERRARAAGEQKYENMLKGMRREIDELRSSLR